MGYNTCPYNVSAWNFYISANFSGIVAYKCQNWNETETHGGDISPNIVDKMFDYISESQNAAGMTDYRKIHIKNTNETATGIVSIRPVLIIPNGLVDRLSITIASGVDYDDMTNKPADNTFGESVNISLSSGEYAPIWLKRTIGACGDDTTYYQNLTIALTVSS